MPQTAHLEPVRGRQPLELISDCHLRGTNGPLPRQEKAEDERQRKRGGMGTTMAEGHVARRSQKVRCSLAA
jgi:hypothetical protein